MRITGRRNFMIAAFITLFMNTALVFAQETEPIRFEQILPRSTLLFAEFSGKDAFLNHALQLDLMKFWRSDPMKVFLEDAKAGFPQLFKENRSADAAFERLWDYFQNTQTGSLDTQSFGLELGQDKKQFMGRIKDLFFQAAKRRNMDQSTIIYRGVEIHLLYDSQKNTNILYAALETFFLATINKDHLKKIIDSYIEGEFVLANDHILRHLVFPFKKYWDLIQGRVSLACSILDQRLSFALAFDTGGDPAIVGALRGLLSENKTKSATQFQGVEIFTLDSPNAMGFFTLKNLLIVSADQNHLRNIVQCSRNRGGALAEDPSLQRALSFLPTGAPSLKFHLNLNPGLKLYEKNQSLRLWTEILGLKGMESASFVSFLKEGASESALYFNCPRGVNNVAELLVSPKAQNKSQLLAPKEALFAWEFAFNTKWLNKELFYGLDHKILLGIYQDLELDQFIEALGPRACFFMDMPQENGALGPMEFGLSIGLKNRKGFLENWEKRIPSFLKSREIKLIPFSLEGRPVFRILPMRQESLLSPTIAILDNQVVITSTAMAMGERLRQPQEVFQNNGAGGVIDLRLAACKAMDALQAFPDSFFYHSIFPLNPEKLFPKEALLSRVQPIRISLEKDPCGLVLKWSGSLGASEILCYLICFTQYLSQEEITKGFGGWMADTFLTNLITYLPFALRAPIYRLITQRSQRLILAIKKYHRDFKKPPDQLKDLAPRYLPRVPSTGVYAFPRFQFDPHKIPWELSIDCSSKTYGQERLIYRPNLKSMGTQAVRIGDWIRVHE